MSLNIEKWLFFQKDLQLLQNEDSDERSIIECFSNEWPTSNRALSVEAMVKKNQLADLDYHIIKLKT